MVRVTHVRACAAMMHLAEWAATAGEEDENAQWLELPEVIYFPSRIWDNRCVYIRDAYRKLADTMEQLRCHVVVSGIPGIGKSCFAHWMLVRCVSTYMCCSAVSHRTTSPDIHILTNMVSTQS